jgi:hypothetical protein
MPQKYPKRKNQAEAISINAIIIRSNVIKKNAQFVEQPFITKNVSGRRQF